MLDLVSDLERLYPQDRATIRPGQLPFEGSYAKKPHCITPLRLRESLAGGKQENIWGSGVDRARPLPVASETI